MFERGAIVIVNNRIGVVVRSGHELCEEVGDDLDDHTGVWFGTMDSGTPEVWTIPTEYLSEGPEPKFTH